LKDNGDAVVWSARADYVVMRLSSLMEDEQKTEILMAAQQKKFSELEARLSKEDEWTESSRTYSRDPMWDGYRKDLAELEMKREALRAGELGEKNPEFKSVEAQITRIKSEMSSVAHDIISAKTESLNPMYQWLVDEMIDTQLSMISYEARLEIIDNMIERLSKEKDQIFSEMTESRFQLDKMRREANHAMNLYEILLGKKLDAEVLANESKIDNSSSMKGGIEIVDTAQPGVRPVSPRVKFIGFIAGLVGLAVGLAMAFLAEYFESTYQSAEEARADLDVPILGMLPSVKDQQPGTYSLPVLESPMSAEAESFRTLVTNIQFSSPGKPHQALLVTSGSAGEGKSFTAANLAAAMAQTKDRVILIDCDMRKGNQHEIFGVDNQIGLANLLVETADLEAVIKDTDIPNLKLITCGSKPPNPVELLRSQRMSEILNELRVSCDVFLCDSPPVLPVTDALILASKLDGVLFVSDLNHTPREVIRQAREQLSRLDVPLLGLVCNKAFSVKYDSYYRSPASKEG